MRGSVLANQGGRGCLEDRSTCIRRRAWLELKIKLVNVSRR